MRWRPSHLGLVLFVLSGTTACQPASAPIPSFSRYHDKKPRDGAEHVQELLATVERCCEASRQDLGKTQLRDRAALLCRQSARALAQSPSLDANATLPSMVRALQRLHESKPPSAQSLRPAIEALELAADEMHQDNDPRLLRELGRHAARWHISGMQLRLALRAWRRCQERSANARACVDKRTKTEEALTQFGRALDSLLAEQPFGTRSFRRCAQRSLLPHPPHAKGVAQLAPDHPSRLRNCERMAARIPWYPI